MGHLKSVMLAIILFSLSAAYPALSDRQRNIVPIPEPPIDGNNEHKELDILQYPEGCFVFS